MRRWYVILVLAPLLLAGCAGLGEFTAADLRAGAALGKAARAADRLAAGDRWPECFEILAARLDQPLPADGATSSEHVGLAVLLMRAHIAAYVRAQPTPAECAQVELELARKGLSLGMSFLPGGAPAMRLLGR